MTQEDKWSLIIIWTIIVMIFLAGVAAGVLLFYLSK